MLKMTKLEFEKHKNQYFSWLLRSEHVKTNIFENRMTKLTIQIGLSLLDFEQLLVDSGSIVQCGNIHNQLQSVLEATPCNIKDHFTLNCNKSHEQSA